MGAVLVVPAAFESQAPGELVIGDLDSQGRAGRQELPQGQAGCKKDEKTNRAPHQRARFRPVRVKSLSLSLVRYL